MLIALRDLALIQIFLQGKDGCDKGIQSFPVSMNSSVADYTMAEMLSAGDVIPAQIP